MTTESTPTSELAREVLADQKGHRQISLTLAQQVLDLEEQLETALRQRDSLAARLRAQGYNVTDILAFDAAHPAASTPASRQDG